MKRQKNNTVRIAFAVVLAFWLIFIIVIIGVVKSLVGVSFAENYISDNGRQILIKNVPYVSQEHILPTGCESACAVMVLQYYGFDISLVDFSENYLDKQEVYYADDGKLHGPSPYEAFAGSPDDLQSYGCYAPVIAKAVNKAVNDTDYNCLITSGESLEQLVDEYVSENIPVLVWVTINMCEPNVGDSWYMQNGEMLVWQAGEHCMVLIGSDDNGYFLLDPYKTNGIVYYDKSLTQTRYAQMGSQSVVLLEN